jgi:hypothetical protein
MIINRYINVYTGKIDHVVYRLGGPLRQWKKRKRKGISS